MGPKIATLFQRAGCAGQICVQPLGGHREVAIGADEPVVSASVFKVCVALEAENQFAEGRLDPRETVLLPAAARTQGPTGFSLFEDDVTVTLRDLVTAMMTISDNAATDALLHRVGIVSVNAASATLGLSATVVTSDLATMIDSIALDSGFDDWSSMTTWLSHRHAGAEITEVVRRMLAATALTPGVATRTTARDMARLLGLIWSDRAGPPSACLRVRQLMAQQLTRHRLATGFPSPARVAAKSGSLVGVVRNEVGVVTFPDGTAYAIAVFTQAHKPWQGETAINSVIGAAAAKAVDALETKAAFADRPLA